jgi:hypothetical protein
LELGGNVRKGEHGTKVYFVKQLQLADRENEEGETRVVAMMREYTVFNVDQCEGLPDRVLMMGEIKPRNRDERGATIDEFVTCSGATIREGAGEAYHRPGTTSSACRGSTRSRAPRIFTAWRSTSWDIMPISGLCRADVRSRGQVCNLDAGCRHNRSGCLGRCWNFYAKAPLVTIASLCLTF